MMVEGRADSDKIVVKNDIQQCLVGTAEVPWKALRCSEALSSAISLAPEAKVDEHCAAVKASPRHVETSDLKQYFV
jgi:hypothetical protein